VRGGVAEEFDHRLLGGLCRHRAAPFMPVT
jgi:hypothetical protein